MTVTNVTRWKTPNVEEATRIAKKVKALWLKRGAVDVRLNMIYTGPDTGQLIFAVVFADWGAYAKAVSAVAQDAESQKLLAAAAKIGAVILEREVLVGIDI